MVRNFVVAVTWETRERSVECCRTAVSQHPGTACEGQKNEKQLCALKILEHSYKSLDAVLTFMATLKNYNRLAGGVERPSPQIRCAEET